MDNEIQDWISAHLKDDTSRLRFKYHGDERLMQAIEQIELRRKAGDKFTMSDGRSLLPEWLYAKVSVEQATSAKVAEFHAFLAKSEKRILDMTMGIGVDSVAFALLNDSCVTAIEMNPDLAAVSMDNYSALSNLTIVNADSVEWLKSSDAHFDMIFIDPARRSSDGSRVYNVHDCTPDVTVIMDLMMAHAPRVMIKLSPMLDVTATLRDLPSTRALYVVEEKGECREILCDLEAGHEGSSVIVAVNGERRLSFTQEEESNANGRYGVPSEGNYLYEPWPSVMKVAPFKLLCEKFNAKAVSSNSHLYFSSEKNDEFPGKCYKIEAVLPYSSGVLKRFAGTYGNASVTVKNFPETAEKLKAKLKIKESSTQRLFATTDVNSRPILILASAISALSWRDCACLRAL